MFVEDDKVWIRLLSIGRHAHVFETPPLLYNERQKVYRWGGTLAGTLELRELHPYVREVFLRGQRVATLDVGLMDINLAGLLRFLRYRAEPIPEPDAPHVPNAPTPRPVAVG